MKARPKVPYTDVEINIVKRGDMSYNNDDLFSAIALAEKEGYERNKAHKFFEKMSKIRLNDSDDLFATMWAAFALIHQDVTERWNQALKETKEKFAVIDRVIATNKWLKQLRKERETVSYFA